MVESVSIQHRKCVCQKAVEESEVEGAPQLLGAEH